MNANSKMAGHRHTTFFAQRCKALSRQAKARVPAIGRPQNCNNMCEWRPKARATTAIKLNISKCCAISNWHSDLPLSALRNARRKKYVVVGHLGIGS